MSPCCALKKRECQNKAGVSLLVHFIFFRWCGEKPDGSVTETSSTNKMTVVFYSDESRVDQGFLAQYEAIDIQNRKQFSFSNNEYSLKLGQCFSC